MSVRAVLVADVAEGVGLGHLSRTSAVAGALRARGVVVEALAFGATNPISRDGIAWKPVAGTSDVVERVRAADAAVLDSYRLQRTDLEAIAAVAPIAWFDDLGEPPEAASMVIAPAQPQCAGPGILSGLAYAPLGPRFWGVDRRAVASAVERVLVTTGGGDPGGLAAGIAKSVGAALPECEVVLVRGPQAPVEPELDGVSVIGPLADLARELSAADLVVCAAGQTMLEACALGTPALIHVAAENQEAGAAELERCGAVLRFYAKDSEDLSAKLTGLAAERSSRESMAAAAQAAVDGYGALRIAFRLERLADRPG